MIHRRNRDPRSPEIKTRGALEASHDIVPKHSESGWKLEAQHSRCEDYLRKVHVESLSATVTSFLPQTKPEK